MGRFGLVLVFVRCEGLILNIISQSLWLYQ